MSFNLIALLPLSSPADEEPFLAHLKNYGALFSKTEPDMQRYSIHRRTNSSTGKREVVVVERFKDAEAFKFHTENPENKECERIIEEAGWVDLKTITAYLIGPAEDGSWER